MAKKIVLAYSGGLDTSIVIKWLIETYNAEVIAFCADLGQGEDLSAVKENSSFTLKRQRSEATVLFESEILLNKSTASVVLATCTSIFIDINLFMTFSETFTTPE